MAKERASDGFKREIQDMAKKVGGFAATLQDEMERVISRIQESDCTASEIMGKWGDSLRTLTMLVEAMNGKR